MTNLKHNLRNTLVALAALCGAAPTASAEEFTILIYETRATFESRNDPDRAEAYWASYNTFAGMLAQAGVLRGGTALSEIESRTLVKRGGEIRLRDTAQSTSGARVGGYFLIDVANIDEATRWAEQAPIASGGAAEVRPHRSNPTMQMAPN